jgi:hypothetical protein
MGTRDEIIARLRQLPEVVGKGDGEIAKICGITSSAWSNYKSEKDNVGTIVWSVALELWNAFGVPMEWIYDGQTAMVPDPEMRTKLATASRKAEEWLASRGATPSEAAWTGLTSRQMRELRRALRAAISDADCLQALPSDAWLDGRLRDYGCPADQLVAWRERIRALPLRSPDGAD